MSERLVDDGTLQYFNGTSWVPVAGAVSIPAGSISVSGTDVSRFGPGKRRSLGLHFVPEERLGRGAVPTLSLAHNVLLTRTEGVGAGGWLRMSAIRAQAAGLIERFKVKAGGPDAAAKSLSGGNLQKFIVGREIDARPKLLIISQPTWGVDVGAAAQIRGELLALRDAGGAVLVVSSELDEILALADRVVVMNAGRITGELSIDECDERRLGLLMAAQEERVAA